jgi:hypothetical protein
MTLPTTPAPQHESGELFRAPASEAGPQENHIEARSAENMRRLRDPFAVSAEPEAEAPRPDAH